MVTFTESDALRGAEFVGTDLSGVVMRGVDVQGADIDAPWLGESGGSLRISRTGTKSSSHAAPTRLRTSRR